MKKISTILMALIMIIISSSVYAQAEITIYSALKSDLYVNGVKQASINTQDPFILQLKEPGTYQLELKAEEKELTHEEQVTLIAETSISKTIRAFESVAETQDKQESEKKEEPAVTRAELKAEVAKAKAAALAEEEARRKREKERELGKKAVIHVIGVEAQKMPSSVKNLERIKILGEVLPKLDKK
jgi:hypothetical protein